MFGAVKLTKNTDLHKYSYPRYGVEFDSCLLFTYRIFDWGKNVYGLDNISSVHIDDKMKNTFMNDGVTQGLNDPTITIQAQYFINFSRSRIELCLSLHYNRKIIFLFVNSKNIWIPTKKPYALCLGNISKDFTVNNMKETELNGYVYNFSVDYIIIDNINITNIHKYLMKKHNIK